MIYGFNSEKEPSLSKVGGKAKALIETTKAGFKVPEGFVLSADFFNSWIQFIKSTEDWKKFLSNGTKENCDILKANVSKLGFNDVQKKAINKALSDMPKGNIFAVRSSSPEEDLEDTSFAGQYDTFLGITKDKLEKYIIKAFASMFDIRVVEYKKLNNISINNPKIAVIVQRQIASEVSGVAFSLNPANNCYDEAMINASFGLGETIVSGQVTPDTYIVEKVKKEILDKKVMEKSIALWLKEDGGIVEKNNENSKKQALSDEEILKVEDLVSRCEKHYKKPMDIEWAIEGEKLYLLQSRPITTYIPLFQELVTKPGEEKYLYIDTIGLSQGFYEPLSVLGIEIWGILMEIGEFHIMPLGVDGCIPTLHGRQYFHISNIMKAMGKNGIKQLLESYDSPTKRAFASIDLKEYIPSKKTNKTKKVLGYILKTGVSVGPSVLKDLISNYENVIEHYVEVSNKSKEKLRYDLDTNLSFEKLVHDSMNYFQKIVNKIGILAVGMLALKKIEKMFKRKGVEDLIINLGMDLKGNPTSAMGHYMYKLACYQDIKDTRSSEEFERRIEKRDYSFEFLEDYDNYMKLYGSRGFKEIDIATPRVYENPGVFFNQLKHINIDDNCLLNVKLRRKEAYDKLLQKAKEGGFEKKFKNVATKYQQTFGYREDPKYVYCMIVNQLRKAALKLGEIFSEEGRLENKNQIFDLTAEEISKAQKDRSFNLMKARENNLLPYKLVEHVKNWPNIIDSRGKIIRDSKIFEEGDMKGDPIAPGIVRGPAKVLYSPYEKTLEPGEILVTKATEPAWTPVFVNAAGVVLEVGGPLQHGAIIAREYGIPCVSGIPSVQSVIKDGDLLEVDGSRGIVKIIE